MYATYKVEIFWLVFGVTEGLYHWQIEAGKPCVNCSFSSFEAKLDLYVLYLKQAKLDKK